MNQSFKLFLITSGLYLAHNTMNGLLYGFDLILVITLLPYVLVGLLWRKMNRIVQGIILALLAVPEIGVLGSNFHGFRFESLSGMLLLSAVILLFVNAAIVLFKKKAAMEPAYEA